MQDYGAHVNTKHTSQRQPILGRPDMKKNNAGGYGFQITPEQMLDRFLILGTIGGTYYVGEAKLTKDSIDMLLPLIEKQGPLVVNRIVEISDAGRAASNDPAIFLLAACAKLGDEATRKAAYAALPQVCRIGTHLFHFARYLEAFGGWGRATRRAFRNWYTNRSTNSLALQLTKYQSRDGWSHKDILRLAHFSQHQESLTRTQNTALRWAAGKLDVADLLQEDDGLYLIRFLEEVGKMDDKSIVQAITEHNVPMELIPTEKRTKGVYEALYPTAGLEWLIRNLGNLSKQGVIEKAFSTSAKEISDRITDSQALKKARIHPLKVLIAMRTYEQGHGFRGKGVWQVNNKIVAALDAAFYLAFAAVEPTRKNRLLALDVSGSMMYPPIANTCLSPREAAAALAMVTYRTETNAELMCFSDRFQSFPVLPNDSLSSVVDRMARMAFGGTDCALPMKWAMQNKLEVDCFEVYTDSETWCGAPHPSQALKEYRQKLGKPQTKSIVVAMEATQFTIADPQDPLMLDVCGLDGNLPSVLSSFISE
jgi:60 kDa SS-A/Ro ribonucleoprotein